VSSFIFLVKESQSLRGDKVPLKKKCSRQGCNVLVDYGVKYCIKHKEEFQLSEKERYKEYSYRRRQDEEQKKYQDFYSSTIWDKARDVVIDSTYGIDIVEFYRTGKIVEGYTVHHIIELDEDWNKRLDIDNLIYLSESNHQHIHNLYKKNSKTKDNTIRGLMELKARFIKEFGG